MSRLPEEPAALARAAPSPASAHHLSDVRIVLGTTAGLEVSEPGDPLELEADRMAGEVMSSGDVGAQERPKIVRPGRRSIQRAPDGPDPSPPTPDAGTASPLAGSSGAGSTTILDPTLGFDVYHGGTLKEIADALPTESGSLTFDISTATDGDPITRATVTVKQEMRLPKWAERDKQCRPVQTAWDSFMSALRVHEDGHVAVNRRELGSAHTQYAGKPAADTQTVTGSLEQKATAAGNAFDTQTDHGRNASPPTTIDLAAKCADAGTATAEDAGTAVAENEPEASESPDAAAVQTKLEVSQPGDPDEEEADRVAEQVMRMEEPRDLAVSGGVRVARRVQRCAACEDAEARAKVDGSVPQKCAECDAKEREEKISRKEASARPVVEASSQVVDVTKSGGQPLDAETRAFMEPRFGFDFSRVRVHAGSRASDAAAGVSAVAYTVGDHIVFGADEYRPQTADGKRLLAHELTHTIQQRDETLHGHTRPVSAAADSVQRQAAPVPAAAAKPGDAPAPAPADAANTPGMSPEDARRLIYARTTLSQIPPLDARDNDTLKGATKDALVFSFIEKRNEKRKALEEATKEYQEDVDNQKDKSGPPTEAETTKKNELHQKMDQLDQEVKDLDGLIKPILATLKVSEDQLVTFVSETFPDMFIARGKKIAIQQLQTNREMAEREKAKYEDVAGAGDVGKPKVDGLRNAAKDLVARRKAIEELQLKIRVADDEKPQGGLADGDQQTSSAYDLAKKDEIQADIDQKQTDLNATRQNYARDYQILYRDDVDLDQLAVATDDQLRATVTSKVDDILENITKTQTNIDEGKVKIWNLQDVLGMTTQDLGIGGNPTLMSVIARRREQEQKDAESDENVASAVKALALTAATIASIATLNPAPLLAVGLVVGTIDVIQHGSQVARVSAARDVALDPAVAQMTAEDPQWGWLIVSIAALLVDAVTGAALLRQHFKALKAAAQTLEAFSAAARRAFPESEAKRLIDVAGRELKSGLDLSEEISAIGGQFRDAERVRIGMALARFMPEGYSEAFLQLSAEGRIVTMSEESIRAAYGGGARAEAMLAKHPPGRSGGFYDKSLNRGTAFVKDQGTVTEIGESVAHELTHNFQKATGILEPLRPTLASMEFYEEMQAFKMQQQFVQNAAKEYGEGVIPKNSSWLLEASEQEIAEQVTARYRVHPDPEVGITAPLADDLVGKMLQRTMKGIDMRREVMKRLEEQLPNE